ncbi:cupin domain-containing protein [Parasphingopyxis sp.]|uniref:cupin domain-containing protein n=1 Tax=Parasphingopyxis sp. TaxID=1920299 RepID=UPI00260262C0|nr:cupin domain-containing protein [Parasphingopyxis sp.]
MALNDIARAICEALRLEPHPEGGWYRETWRAPEDSGARSAGTAIHFLLGADERSHWHTVDAAEIWCWHAGDPLMLELADERESDRRTVTLGADVLAGHVPQAIVPAHHWQAARSVGGSAGYSLVSCIVVPGFDFAGFTLAPPDWNPGQS